MSLSRSFVANFTIKYYYYLCELGRKHGQCLYDFSPTKTTNPPTSPSLCSPKTPISQPRAPTPTPQAKTLDAYQADTNDLLSSNELSANCKELKPVLSNGRNPKVPGF